jgi:hypothetical protein
MRHGGPSGRVVVLSAGVEGVEGSKGVEGAKHGAGEPKPRKRRAKEAPTRVGKTKRAVPPRIRLAAHRGYRLSLDLLCECGEERRISAFISRGGIDRSGLVAPCCLRRYRVTDWTEDGPVLECVGVEDWRGMHAMVTIPIKGETTLEAATRENEALDRRERERVRTTWPSPAPSFVRAHDG